MPSKVEFSSRFTRLRAVAAVALVISLLQSGAAFAAGTTLRVTPGSLNFGAEVFGVTGATSAPKMLTIFNPKSAAQSATIATLSIGDADSADFALEDLNDCSGTVLEPGEKCSLEVTFVPTRLGAISSTLTVTDAGGNSAKPVGLKGSGVRGALQFKPHTLAFPRTQRGTLSYLLPVTLTNGNPVALAISNITAGAGFVLQDNCPQTLEPGVSCQVWVMFSPPAAQSSKAIKLTGTLIIIDDAAASPQKVQLSGVAFGTTPPPTPTPSATPTPTATPAPTATAVSATTAVSTATVVSTETPTATPTPTPTPEPTPTPTPTSNPDTDCNAHSDCNPNTNVHADSDTHANADCNSNPDAHSDADANPDANADADANPDANADANSNSDPDANANSDANPNPNADTDTNANSDANSDPDRRHRIRDGRYDRNIRFRREALRGWNRLWLGCRLARDRHHRHRRQLHPGLAAPARKAIRRPMSLRAEATPARAQFSNRADGGARSVQQAVGFHPRH